MWKNIFLESCILSALIFSGFFLNTTLLQDELYDNMNSSSHISGLAISYDLEKHISGQITEKKSPDHISGMVTPEEESPTLKSP